MAKPPVVAYFITPHGFGHASRAAAVMAALSDAAPEVRFELFTTCPRWIFHDTLGKDFGYHPEVVDIGMVQISPLQEDVSATVRALDRWLPFDDALVARLAGEVADLRCRLIVCDIAPLGIAVAQAAGIPSVLVENFTWDWIYSGYLRHDTGLQSHIAYLAEIFEQAAYHLQTEPLSRLFGGTVKIAPISRKVRSSRARVRQRLGLNATDPMVLVSMGGVPDRLEFLSKLPDRIAPVLVIPGADGRTCSHPRVILLPVHSDLYHPDLVAAADALIAKAGYSIVAEAYHAGVPFGYVRRPQSPESEVLEKFIVQHLPSRSITAEAYADGTWIHDLPDLLHLPRATAKTNNGADEAARYLLDLLTEEK
jgi:hypothetical protein